MLTINCKICGGPIVVSDGKLYETCEYCGSTVTVPHISDERRAAMFNRGNDLRRSLEFDKAFAVFEQIVLDDDADAEAHWCCVLCRYGIEYVKDPTSEEWIPTCHQISFDRFLEDQDYLAAERYSEGVAQKLYRKEAKHIAQIQEDILNTYKTDRPFDIFICCKETDVRGNRTPDSYCAKQIYSILTEKGYHVFLSQVSLADIAGFQYEPYIFTALYSSKIMIVVSTQLDYLEEPWVHNEWKRFLTMGRRDSSKVLIPCYQDINPKDMPYPLCRLQSFDMRPITFGRNLIHRVEKILPPVQSAPAIEAPKTLDSHIIVGFLDLELGKRKSAANIFRRVLMEDSSFPEAYLGMFLIAKDTERRKYGEKFRQYASSKMSSLERRIFTPDLQKMLLFGYMEIGMSDRIREALSLYRGGITDDLFIAGITTFPNPEIIQPFLEHGCDINLEKEISDQDGRHKIPLLSYLIGKNSSIPVLNATLECGADPNCIRILTTPDHREQYYSALSDCICRCGNTKTVQLLLAHNADPNFINREYVADGTYSEKSLLYEAVERNQLGVVKSLLDYGADPNVLRLCRDGDHDSVFSILYDCVCRHLEPDMAVPLLENGADVHLHSKLYNADGTYEEKTPLSEAVLRNNYEMTALLLEYEANPNRRRILSTEEKESHISPLSDCILRTQNIDIADLLLQNGATTEEGRTVGNCSYSMLGDSIRLVKNIQFVRLLLKYGANPSRVDDIYSKNSSIIGQENMLMLAALDAQSPEMLSLLHKYGASVDTVVWYNYLEGPFRFHPFYMPQYGLPESVLTALRNIGWTGPGILGFFKLRRRV